MAKLSAAVSSTDEKDPAAEVAEFLSKEATSNDDFRCVVCVCVCVCVCVLRAVCASVWREDAWGPGVGAGVLHVGAQSHQWVIG